MWEDNIREWTGLEFAKSLKAVKNREKWRKLVVKSSVVLQRPPRLRDKGKMVKMTVIIRNRTITYHNAASCYGTES